MKQQNIVANLTRREALYGLGTGIGSLAFSSLAQAESIHSIGPITRPRLSVVFF
jgi:tetrahydromethanopterin S-methyltransferase subunit C